MALGRKPIEIVEEGKHQMLVKASNWERIFLKNIAKVQNGFAFSSVGFNKTEGMPLIRIRDIDQTNTVDRFKGVYQEEFIIERDDILIGMDGDFKAARWKGEKALLNQRVCRIKPFSLDYDSKFLFLCLQPYLNAIHEETSAVTVKHLSSKTIEDIPLPYPKLREQQLIVSKIEELFSELDKGVEELKKVQQQLKVYRQSVLKWAFEGKLTEEWRKKQGASVRIQSGLSRVVEGLPDGWKWAALEDISTVGTGATPLKGKKEFYENGKIAWVTSGALNDDFVKEATDWVTEIALRQTNLKVYPIHTLLIAMYGEGKTRGKCSELLIEACTNQAIAAIHFTKHDIRVKSFLKHFLQKNYEDIRRLSSGGVQPNLNLGIVKKTLIPFPTYEEQYQIVQEIETRLSECDKIEETIINSLQQSEALRQSILKQAFEGKLVKAKEDLITKPKNVFFYQSQLLGIIAKASKQKKINHGEMTIAKYLYLADKVFGIPSYYNFERWHLGPYPPEIKKAIKNKKFFTSVKNAIELADEETLLKYNNPFREQLESAVETLTSIFSNVPVTKRSHQTELLATVCKVIEDIKTVDLNDVRVSMKEWKIDLKTTSFKNKAEKFSEEETKECLDLIVKNGWEKKLIL